MARKSAENVEVALKMAQDLMYEAWEASTAKRRVALAEKALALSPLCADAYVVLAQHAERGSDKEFDLWRRGVEAGKKALGEAAFAEYVGDFWGILETRPYLRARCGLVRALWARGARDEAIVHLRDILRLNPNDNQGARYVLAALLVEAGRDEDLAVLLKKYPDDGAAAWSWTTALLAFRRSGDTKESRALLTQALADNGHVPALLFGERPLPRLLPSYISPGDEDEAIYYVVDFRTGWVKSPGAIEWLRVHAPAPKTVKHRRPGRSRLR